MYGQTFNQQYPMAQNYNYGYQPSYQSQMQQMNFQQPQMQQVSQLQQRQSPYCRIVSTQEEIRADEVPMDGNIGVFVSKDMNEIYAKSWNAMTGRIDTITYVPVLDEKQEIEGNVVNEDIAFNFNKEMESLKNELFERFDKLERNFNKPQMNRSKGQKEGE